MRRLSLVLLYVGLIAVGPTDSASGQPGPQVGTHPPPGSGPQRPRRSTGGTVTEVGKDFITIKFHAHIETAVHQAPDGRVLKLVDRVIPATEPMRYVIAQPLANGKPPLWFGDMYSYRVSDVLVGDHVTIGWSEQNGAKYCEMICIYNRPGGKIPPAPGEPQDARWPWHEIQQARMDRLERGVPMPDKFLSPEELAERYARVAPPPRELLAPRIPAAKP